jgi:hypothetical protein
MKLRKVTLTGADDQTDVVKMYNLYKAFPFVEYGILVSQDSGDLRPRFPSTEWISELEPMYMQLSMHLCGRWAREIADGYRKLLSWLPHPHLFERFQLNIWRELMHMESFTDQERFMNALPDREHDGREIILQVGMLNDHNIRLMRFLTSRDKNVSVLVDASGGRGITPNEWPSNLPALRCGLAGGLGPPKERMRDLLSRMEDQVGDQTIWIDMETRVRDRDDRFSIDLATEAVEVAADWCKDWRPGE